MIHAKASSGKKDESEAGGGCAVPLLYVPLFVAAAALLAVIVTLHLMYDPWLLDPRYRRYSLYMACALTVAAFLVCFSIAFFIRRKQMYKGSSYVTARTRLLDGKSYLPLYVGVHTPPAKMSVLPVTFVAPPVNAAKPAAG